MTNSLTDRVAPVTSYARRLHRVIGDRHHVASPLGAWLLLALCGPASEGANRTALTEVLGCDVDQAARLAAELLASPHPLVAEAAAVWCEPGVVSGQWLEGLPPAVETGPVPDQAGADAWARDHTFGLIDKFPVDVNDVYLVLASALATKVSWEYPFDLTAGSALGPASPWAGRLSRVLATPRHPGHEQFIAETSEAGDVAVHVARARGGLLVASVIAAPGVPAADVLAVAYRLGCARAVGSPVQRRSLFDLPMGDGPFWSMREEMSAAGPGERCSAVLPAWSARSRHDLTDPDLGFATAKLILAGPQDPWDARQAAMARYSRIGFEAAAVSALAVALSMRSPGLLRTAELRFGHPFAVVAVTVDEQASGGRPGPWHGMPVFSAWVTEPENATNGELVQPHAAAEDPT